MRCRPSLAAEWCSQKRDAHMTVPLIDRIIADEKVTLVPDDLFLRAYPEFLRYFRDVATIETHHLIIAANFTYGWMPTMLRFKSERFDEAAAVLNNAKAGKPLGDDEILCLKRLTNNSLVGTSKLLHFANPHHYAIWDSRVYQYLHGNFSLYQLHRLVNYRAYLETCCGITEHRAFPLVHQSINAKVGYDVTPMRAVELVMYMNGLQLATTQNLV
jgi:hypothetical protein